MTKPRDVLGLKLGGRRLWNRVQGDFELAQHEETILLQACRIVDVLDRLQAVIDDGEVVVESPQGSKVNPAIVEFRQQSVTLAKCMASLRIPIDFSESAGGQSQQRAGVRRAGSAVPG